MAQREHLDDVEADIEAALLTQPKYAFDALIEAIGDDHALRIAVCYAACKKLDLFRRPIKPQALFAAYKRLRDLQYDRKLVMLNESMIEYTELFRWFEDKGLMARVKFHETTDNGGTW